MSTAFGFLVHYWLFTTAVIAALWVLTIHLLRHTAVGPLGRALARREEQRVEDYRSAVTDETVAISDE